MQAEPHFSYDPATQGQRVDFAAGRPPILTIAFTLLWLAGWLFLLALLALHYLRFGSLNVADIVLLVVGGIPVAIALLWAASGKRESLIVTPSELRIYRWAGPDAAFALDKRSNGRRTPRGSSAIRASFRPWPSAQGTAARTRRSARRFSASGTRSKVARTGRQLGVSS